MEERGVVSRRVEDQHTLRALFPSGVGSVVDIHM